MNFTSQDVETLQQRNAARLAVATPHVFELQRLNVKAEHIPNLLGWIWIYRRDNRWLWNTEFAFLRLDNLDKVYLPWQDTKDKTTAQIIKMIDGWTDFSYNETPKWRGS